MHRGPGRASFMWGSSTRNTRIERLWVEVGTQFARRWRAFFTRLGRLHGLDRKAPAQLWLLHQLFLPALNEDCNEFQEEWNLHPISGRMSNNQSPAVRAPAWYYFILANVYLQDMRFLGQTTEGIYHHDPLDGIHPDSINRYYGVAGARRHRNRHQTGAGIASDEEDDCNGYVPYTAIIPNVPVISTCSCQDLTLLDSVSIHPAPCGEPTLFVSVSFPFCSRVM
ncbi:hypothetical protein GGX14DRAFT_359551 [Mycena pura]|uniref:Integrase core domain-containing protein n=1 Tax=Mycena pura TaxID=153505 RepID=A0AAD6VKJ3_9AGAR|nr:hypothetical protein GGX14DRAFT_359551 [Mycena pura]